MTDRLEEIEAYWPSKTSAMALGDIEWLIAEVERLRVDNLEIADRAERLVAHRNILITECESLEAEVKRLREIADAAKEVVSAYQSGHTDGNYLERLEQLFRETKAR